MGKREETKKWKEKIEFGRKTKAKKIKNN